MDKFSATEIRPMTEDELDNLLGADGGGAVVTLTKDCHMNTKQSFLGCCDN